VPLAYIPGAASANPLAAIDNPMPRPKPAAIGGAKPAPVQVAAVGNDLTLPAAAPVAAPGVGSLTAMSIANRIAGATGLLSRKPAPKQQQVAETVEAPRAAAQPARANPLFAVANRIAVAALPADRENPRTIAVTGSTVRADFSGKLPETYFTDRIAVRDRIALAYASSDISIAPARLQAATPMPRARSATPQARRHQLVVAAPPALTTVELDAAGWHFATIAEPMASARVGVVAPRARDLENLVTPARAMPFGFGSDPAYGCVSGRFAGYPVMFIRTIDLASR
jgi:hypothetical protein